MSEGWTKGPWFFQPARIGEVAVFGNFGHCERVIADDPGPESAYTIGFVHDVDAPTRRANANLIAAAPELYEALKRAEQFIAKVDELHNTIYFDGLHEQCQGALAKARGEV